MHWIVDRSPMLKIATWNVNGIRARQVEVAGWVAREQPDVLCLQEIKAAPDQVPITLVDLDGYWCRWHGGKGYSGVALLARKAVAPEAPAFCHPAFDFETRVVAAKIGRLSVASIYVPNGGKDFPAKLKFLDAMAGHARAAHEASESLVLCGDLNVTRTDRDVHPKERKPNAIGQLPEERDLLERIIAHNLVDVGRALDPDNDELFTWWPPWRSMKARNIGWRLDYILASRDVAERAARCSVLREVGTSDHGPVVAEFDLPPGMLGVE
jgi:exodeoxyribonuclease III